MPHAPPTLRLPVAGWQGSCEVCRRWCQGSLCDDCRARFAAPRWRCVRCGLPLGAADTLCGSCLSEAPAFTRCVCAVDYNFPWDRLVARMKFDGQPELASPLAVLLARAAPPAADDRPGLFAAVPLSDERLAERGYDQAWELARRLGSQLGVPARPRVLRRRFDGRHQLGLSRRERLANLRGAFAVAEAERANVQGAFIGLVDDVMTTGATAGEAAAALLSAGARRVDLWVVARTPAPQAGT